MTPFYEIPQKMYYYTKIQKIPKRFQLIYNRQESKWNKNDEKSRADVTRTSKIGVSVAPRKGLVSYKKFLKKKNDEKLFTYHTVPM